jgi:hypothetical protein
MVAFDCWIGVENRNNDNLVVDGDYKSDQPTAHIDSCRKVGLRATIHGPFSIIIADRLEALCVTK